MDLLVLLMQFIHAFSHVTRGGPSQQQPKQLQMKGRNPKAKYHLNFLECLYSIMLSCHRRNYIWSMHVSSIQMSKLMASTPLNEVDSQAVTIINKQYNNCQYVPVTLSRFTIIYFILPDTAVSCHNCSSGCASPITVYIIITTPLTQFYFVLV